MATEKYNGWTNYETWCVHLWLTNDQAASERVTMLARSCDEIEAADRLKESIEMDLEDISLPASMFTDLLNAALSEVNWAEIAKSLRVED